MLYEFFFISDEMGWLRPIAKVRCGLRAFTPLRGAAFMAADYDGVGIMVEGVERGSDRRARGVMKNATLTGKICVSK